MVKAQFSWDMNVFFSRLERRRLSVLQASLRTAGAGMADVRFIGVQWLN
jgi:hypothetical protein